MASWGPLLWSILHTAAEHLGKARPALLQTDETNRWMFFLKSVEAVMPCKVCRKHYEEWLKTSPISQFTLLRGAELRERSRKWLYTLHEKVNAGKGVQSGISLEDLPTMYTSLANYQSQIDSFYKLIKDNIQNGLLKAEETRKFISHFQYLRKITDTI
jgi:hypothetical protein